MKKRSARNNPGLQSGRADESAFIRRFLDNPRRTGAVAPSGPYLARAMARAVDPDLVGQIVELGPGTGPVTKALIARGIPRERLTLVEFDPHFCRILAERYPTAQIVKGDAFDLRANLSGRLKGPVAAVVSSLPLLNERVARRFNLLSEAFDLMGPDGTFVQFTYGLKSPIPREALVDRYSAKCGAPILRNLPPASVWTYRRSVQSVHESKGLSLLEHAELLATQISVKRKVAETIVRQHGDRVRFMLVREAGDALNRLRRIGEDR